MPKTSTALLFNAGVSFVNYPIQYNNNFNTIMLEHKF